MIDPVEETAAEARATLEGDVALRAHSRGVRSHREQARDLMGSSSIQSLIGNLSSVAPGAAHDILDSMLRQLQHDRGGAGIALVIAILLGLEFDAELERGRAIDTGHPPGEEPYAEPRDTRELPPAGTTTADVQSEAAFYKIAYKPICRRRGRERMPSSRSASGCSWGEALLGHVR
ncbi:hypothetical protein ACZ90_43510 [Streptomyces albus subsp. albus]|nr:hypothetical protein ACZ90_43510 [Streptomyces albus subsp. albus]